MDSLDLTRDAGEKTLPPKVLRPYPKPGCLAPPCSASPCRLASFESRASSLNVPALEESSSILPSLVPNAPDSLPPRVSPSAGLPSNTIYDLSTPSLPHPPSTGPLPGFLPSGQSAIGPEIESLEAFFTAALRRSEEGRVKSKEERVKERVKLLTGVVEGISKAQERPDGLHESFWSKWLPIFEPEPELGSEAESTSKTFEARYADRFRRLKQIRDGIPKKDWRTSRIWLICVHHEIEHISQWEGIDAYTSRGVDPWCVAIKIVRWHLGLGVSNLVKRCNNIVHVMALGGPAAVLLDNGAESCNVWEREMTRDDINVFYTFKQDRLPQTKSYDPDAAHAITGCFLRYGWSSSELLSSSTKVMKILGPYLAGAGPGSDTKRQRLDQSRASASCPDHNFSSDEFIDQATSCGIDNTVGSMPRSISSHLFSSARRNWRNLTDPATRVNLDYAIASSVDITDPATRSHLDYADLATADFVQNTHDQSMNYETDSFFQCTFNGSDPATDMFLEAIPTKQLYHIPIS